MERQVWCWTHSDQDGMVSGAVVKQRYPNCTVMYTNYGKSRNFWKVKPGDLVFVTDFTLNLDEFERLKQKNAEVIWIDHHEANYKLLESQGWNCQGIRRNDYAGCALTWMYFHPNLPPEAMPDVIKLTNDYDLWTFNDPRSKDFAQGLGLWDLRSGTKSGDTFWNAMFSNDDTVFKLVLKYGEHIRKYVEIMQDTYCNDLAYYVSIPTAVGQKNVLAMTVRAGNSAVFDRMNKDGVDALFSGQYVANIGRYRCSMYSPDNIKEILPIVQQFGGGGHPKAAGFGAESYPLPTPTVKDPVPMEQALEAYKKLFDLRQASAILKQWFDRSSSITMKAIAFHTEFCNYPVMACNHQFLPDLADVGSTAINIINPETSMPAKFYLSWAMTNTGWFRCAAYPTDSSVTVDDMIDALKKTHPDVVPSITKYFNGVWWYSKEIPVRPPIVPIPQVQSAKI